MNNVIPQAFRTEILEGKHKVVYGSETKGIFVLYHKEENLKHSAIRAILSSKIFNILTLCGIHNHFLCINGMYEHKVTALDMLPFKIHVHSVITEDLSKKFFLKPGLRLENYLLEIILRGSESTVSKEHLLALKIMQKTEIEALFNSSKRIMDIISAFFFALGITVFSLSLSFGRKYNDDSTYEILLADEFSLKNIGIGLNFNVGYNQDEVYKKIADKLNLDF